MPLVKEEGIVYQSKTFVLNAAGTSIVGSDAGITLEQSGAIAIIRIPTTKTLKLWQGMGRHTGNLANTNCCNGRSDGQIQNSITHWNNGLIFESYIDINNCIALYNISDAWEGLITTITSTYFEITLTKVGIGLAISCQMHLIEG